MTDFSRIRMSKDVYTDSYARQRQDRTIKAIIGRAGGQGWAVAHIPRRARISGESFPSPALPTQRTSTDFFRDQMIGCKTGMPILLRHREDGGARTLWAVRLEIGVGPFLAFIRAEPPRGEWLHM